MYARQELTRRFLPPRQDGNFMLIAFLFQASVAFPAISMHHAPRLNRFFYKRFQTARRSIFNSTHTYPANTPPIRLCSNDYQSFLLHFAPTNALFFCPQVGFVNLCSSRQSITSGPHHGTSQFMQPRPRGLVAAQTENPLQTQSAGPRLQRRQPPDSPEPQHQRFVGIFENRPGCHGGMISAGRANYQVSLRHPSSVSRAPRANESFGPTEQIDVLPASLFCRKTCLEFRKRPGIIFHGPVRYILRLLESSKYPLLQLILSNSSSHYIILPVFRTSQ